MSRLGDGVAACVEGAFFHIALAAEPPIGERGKIVGDGFNGRAQFEPREPALGDRFDSGASAQKIAGDRARRVAVSAVIHSENNSVFKIFCSERAIDPHCQSFLGHEPLSKFTQRTTFAGARLCQAFSFLDGGQSFLMGWMFAELFFCRVNGFGERLAHKRQADDDGKRPRAETAARMSVSDRGEIAAGCKDIRKQAAWITLAAQRMREVHAHGGHAHHSAAAFAVVHGPRHPAAAGLQCRAPGTTCLSALQTSRGRVTRAMNDSKGCGGVMRMAPVGIYFAHSLSRERNPDRLLSNIFTTGSELAAITHGHPSGCLSAGTFAVIVGLTLVGKSLTEAIHSAKEELRKHPSHKETLAAVEKAESLAKSRPRERSGLRELGKGFVAEEALAMGIYCALGAKDFEDGIILAVNHSGDSDSTGSITGNLLGAGAGVEAIPERWLARLELRSTIEAIADDLAAFPDWRLRSQGDVEERAFYASRYPVA